MIENDFLMDVDRLKQLGRTPNAGAIITQCICTTYLAAKKWRNLSTVGRSSIIYISLISWHDGAE